MAGWLGCRPLGPSVEWVKLKKIVSNHNSRAMIQARKSMNTSQHPSRRSSTASNSYNRLINQFPIFQRNLLILWPRPRIPKLLDYSVQSTTLRFQLGSIQGYGLSGVSQTFSHQRLQTAKFCEGKTVKPGGSLTNISINILFHWQPSLAS
jgi:hypothetical protein